ncbi:short-chain dehydrogenase [Dyadobacter frigoris]|uniref:SDR family oxidoreductase n=1 Tax=Dyadobacter frigoris TaxID=2576211 RepID=UPI00249FE62F|nr:SDR family oxidoreductase [Dyadobacter frigoris]GLU55212.1 short-chain dehydrogenase [Dyadobacter frigoris]
MKKLENKVAVVIGGNSGIGLATAKLFAAEGAMVTITGRNSRTVDQAVEEIGHNGLGLVSDISNLDNIDSQYKIVNESFGKIDVLVINAGVNFPAPLESVTEEIFDQISNINFKGVFFSVQRALTYLNDGASIILTSSTASEKGFANFAAYSATKAAVRSLARSFSAELLNRSIRVNVLSPGPVDTPIFERGESKEDAATTKDIMASLTPVKRLALPEEIASGFLYLASDDSKYMLGSELLLDGGVRSL